MVATFLLYINIIFLFFTLKGEPRSDEKSICQKQESILFFGQHNNQGNYQKTKEILLPIAGGIKTTNLILLCGDALSEISDIVYDDESRSFDPSIVVDGAVILVGTHLLSAFFSDIHPFIEARYILISHNSDDPSPGKFEEYLDDQKIIAWIGQNASIADHPKFHPIPIGIANHQYGHGNVEAFFYMQKQVPAKKRLAYINFALETFPAERVKVFKLLHNEHYCYTSSPKEFVSYLKDLRESKFVLSPRGNGLDCHRTWEAILMGAIPAVRTSFLDKLYDDLPVLIVQDWEEINEEYLQHKYEEITAKTYCLEKLCISYWRVYIKNILAEAGIYR